MVRTAHQGALAAVAMAMLGCAGGPAADGSEPRLYALELPLIAKLTIEENAAKAPAEGGEADCSGFVLNAEDVRVFLERAGAVSEHDYRHTLDWSPCYAAGTVQFADGLTGTWGIQQLRAGSLSLSDGRTLYLYCPRCRSGPFLGP